MYPPWVQSHQKAQSFVARDEACITRVSECVIVA